MPNNSIYGGKSLTKKWSLNSYPQGSAETTHSDRIVAFHQLQHSNMSGGGGVSNFYFGLGESKGGPKPVIAPARQTPRSPNCLPPPEFFIVLFFTSTITDLLCIWSAFPLCFRSWVWCCYFLMERRPLYTGGLTTPSTERGVWRKSGPRTVILEAQRKPHI